jgi:putative Holliday junction resolvase
LAIDFGNKRIGLAISDESATVALGLENLAGGPIEKTCQAIIKLATERAVGEIVVGVPLRLSGEASEQTEHTLKFIAALEQVTAIPVRRWDERLTSVQAERAMLEGDLRRRDRKANRDRLAAQILLQSYLDAQNIK